MNRPNLQKEKNEIKELGEILFYGFDDDNNVIYGKSKEGLISIGFEVYSNGKSFIFQEEFISKITIKKGAEAKKFLKPIGVLEVDVQDEANIGSAFQQNLAITLKDKEGNEWLKIVEYTGDGFNIPEYVSVNYEPVNTEPIFLNPTVISSNLFMNEFATENTMKKLSHFSKTSSVVIINNAEPAYGCTSVTGFKKYGFTNVVEMTVSKEQLNIQLPLIESADIVVLTGGNPWMLLQDLQATNVLLHIKDNATIVGVSAGAMVLGRDIEVLDDLAPEYNENKSYNLSIGYNLFGNKNIIPHYDEYFSKERIEELMEDYGPNFIFINQIDEIVDSL